jgi:hypothetical protein
MTIIATSLVSNTTALDIINASLRLLQVKNDDVVLTASEANDALEALNMMIDGWSNESLMLSHITKESFTLTPNQVSYSLGLGGDFNTDRPVSVEAATITINGADFPVQQMAFDDWSAIRLKSLATGYTEYFYVDETFPLSTVYLYPISTIASTLTLYSRKPFVGFANLTDQITLPPGYTRAMKYQLACEIASEYQTTAGQDVQTLAMTARAGLKRVNKRPITTQVDPALMASGQQRFNIYRGT